MFFFTVLLDALTRKTYRKASWRNEEKSSKASEQRLRATYTNQNKAKFLEVKQNKVISASAAAKQLCINVRVAQRWAREYEKNLDAVFDKGERRGRKTILQDEHKEYLIDCYDKIPDVTDVEATNLLTEQFAGLKITKSAIYDFMTKECNLSIKRAHLQAAARSSQEQINQRCAWIQQWGSTDMNYLQNCVFLD